MTSEVLPLQKKREEGGKGFSHAEGGGGGTQSFALVFFMW